MKPSSQSPTQRFSYKAINARGKAVTGEISAANLALAKVMLHKQGLAQITIKPAAVRVSWRKSRVRPADALLGLRTLATLISSGLVLTQALDIAKQTTNSTALAAYLTKLKTDIETGHSFAAAIDNAPPVFGALAYPLIDAGEKSGALDVMLDRLATYSEQQATLRATVKQAVRYPLIVLIVALVVMAILLLKVVPSFAMTFASMGETLPLPTRIVLGLSQFLQSYFWLIFMSIIGVIVIGVTAYQRSAALRHRWAVFSLRLPVIGALIRLVGSARFARTLSTTFGAGVPLPQALSLAARATDHPIFISATEQIISQIHSGHSLFTAIKNTDLFSPMSVQMIGVGESSGKLVPMLEKVADYHEQQIHAKVSTITGMIEPVMIVVLGVLIGGLVLAMYLPLFNLGAGL